MPRFFFSFGSDKNVEILKLSFTIVILMDVAAPDDDAIDADDNVESYSSHFSANRHFESPIHARRGGKNGFVKRLESSLV